MQHDRLILLENLIAHNQCHFHEIGKALKEIRDKRLYKKTLFETFEAYTKARWDMGKSQAYRLINAYQVVHNLSPIGVILPCNEFQVRPLMQLGSFEQRKVWKDFLNTGIEITALNIKKFISACKSADKGKPIDLTDQISREYMDAVRVMLEQVRIAQNDHWQKTSRQAGLLWNRVIQEKILQRSI
ncbi:MAG: DNA methylase [Proteobacteria bacterium]|nr:DNA methylase [Pseudomonadota bacterium]